MSAHAICIHHRNALLPAISFHLVMNVKEYIATLVQQVTQGILLSAQSSTARLLNNYQICSSPRNSTTRRSNESNPRNIWPE
jgi:hypothetical protein